MFMFVSDDGVAECGWLKLGVCFVSLSGKESFNTKILRQNIFGMLLLHRRASCVRTELPFFIVVGGKSSVIAF